MASLLLLTRYCLHRRKQGGSAGHDNTVPLNITPGQHSEDITQPKSKATLKGENQAVDIPEVGTKSQIRLYVYQYRTVLKFIILQILLFVLWALVTWIEDRNKWYLFTNYRKVGVWTNELQERVFWTAIVAVVVCCYTRSVKGMFIGGAVVFILPLLGKRFGLLS